MGMLYRAVWVKNLLICAGAYYLARWVTLPLAFGFGKLTGGITYSGDFKGAVVAPLVLKVPVALVAAAVGASVVWLVDSSRPQSWVLFPAALYGFFGFLGYHGAHTPLPHDRVFQTVGALFPAVACILGGIVASRRRAIPPAAQVIPT
jgi:hypothetical protein